MLLSLFLLPLLSLAAPSPPKEEPSHHQPKLYYLRTAASEIHSHNNLYVSAFHTGAGLNDAVVQPDQSNAAKGYLDETRQQFKLGTELPWGMVLGGAAKYAQWGTVQINVGQGTPGFSIDGDHLIWDSKQGFEGWLVCDWYHGVPQLFWLQRSVKVPFPPNCAKVELKVEYLKDSKE